jgi:c(7)-type cytochrome triheme protein
MITIGGIRMVTAARWIALVAAIAIATMTVMPVAGALAQGLPRLPADRAIPGAGESPGTVTFSHESHVDLQKPACTSCHPSKFTILKASAPRAGAITHAGMDAGRQCGACHDGKAAFGLDQCDLCHRK